MIKNVSLKRTANHRPTSCILMLKCWLHTLFRFILQGFCLGALWKQMPPRHINWDKIGYLRWNNILSNSTATSFSDSKRGCNFTTRVDEHRYSTYSQRFLSPYYYTSLQQNVICLHRIERIPEKAYVAFSIFYGNYDHGNQNFTVSNGTDYEYIFSNRNPVYMRQLDGTNSLLLNFTGGKSYSRLKYSFKGNGRYDGNLFL